MSFATAPGVTATAAQPDADEAALTEAVSLSGKTLSELEQIITDTQAQMKLLQEQLEAAQKQIEQLKLTAVTFGDCMDDSDLIGCADLREVKIADIKTMQAQQTQEAEQQAALEDAKATVDKMLAEMVEGNKHLVAVNVNASMVTIGEVGESNNRLVTLVLNKEFKRGNGVLHYQPTKWRELIDAEELGVENMAPFQQQPILVWHLTEQVNKELANTVLARTGETGAQWERMPHPEDTDGPVLLPLASLSKLTQEQQAALELVMQAQSQRNEIQTA
jgi:hypothetical protein